MKQYLRLLKDVLENGELTGDRTGIGTRSVFGRQVRFDLSKGLPIVTTKKIFFKGIVAELLWFLSGSTNVKPLQDQGVHIWDEWADEKGELGPVYGHQWRSWQSPSGETHDQITEVIDQIKNNPTSRRLIVSAWNVADIPDMKLPPCHCLFQFKALNGKLHCQLYQRSADIFLGVPFNITSYALLTMLIAQVCGLEPGEFVHTFGDLHLYNNHVDQAKEQLGRKPFNLPSVLINPRVGGLFNIKLDDIQTTTYRHHPEIKAPVAV